MKGIESRLREHLASVDQAAVRPDDLLPAVARARRRLRRRRQLAGCAAVAVVVAAGAVTVAARHDRRSLEITAPGTTASPPTAAPLATATTTSSVPAELPPSGWTPIAPDPRGVTALPAVAWTGTTVIAVGGRDPNGVPRASAAEYDPSADEWRLLADIPDGIGRADLGAVATGGEVLVLGGVDAGGSAVASDWALSDGAGWRRLSARPGGAITSLSPMAWTGSELLVWPGDGRTGAIAAPLAYNPLTDRWRVLPAPPIGGRQHAASVWTGSEWLLWGGTTGTAELADGAAYDPATDSWRAIAASPLTPRRVLAVWTGSEMLVAAGSSGGDRSTGNGALALSDAAAYDPATDRWRTLTFGLAHPGFLPVWTGSRMIMFAKGGAVTFDPATDEVSDDCCGGTWFQSTPLPLNGGTLLIGGSAPSNGGAVYVPPSAAESAALARR